MMSAVVEDFQDQQGSMTAVTLTENEEKICDTLLGITFSDFLEFDRKLFTKPMLKAVLNEITARGGNSKIPCPANKIADHYKMPKDRFCDEYNAIRGFVDKKTADAKFKTFRALLISCHLAVFRKTQEAKDLEFNQEALENKYYQNLAAKYSEEKDANNKVKGILQDVNTLTFRNVVVQTIKVIGHEKPIKELFYEIGTRWEGSGSSHVFSTSGSGKTLDRRIREDICMQELRDASPTAATTTSMIPEDDVEEVDGESVSTPSVAGIIPLVTPPPTKKRKTAAAAPKQQRGTSISSSVPPTTPADATSSFAAMVNHFPLVMHPHVSVTPLDVDFSVTDSSSSSSAVTSSCTSVACSSSTTPMSASYPGASKRVMNDETCCTSDTEDEYLPDGVKSVLINEPHVGFTEQARFFTF